MKAIIKFGYEEFVLPLEDALVLFRTFENAERTDEVWNSDTKEHERYIGGKTPKLRVELFSDDEYAVAKMRGPKPETPF